MDKYFYDLITTSGTLSFEDVVVRMIFSIILGCAIFISYLITHSGTVYSKKFNITLLTLTVLTTTVMTVIGNNIALSLGMVGALSIIRFRTSIKDSRDTIYIFWTIIVGICCGVGDYTVASIGSVSVFLVLLLFGRVKSNNRILVIIRANRHLESEIRNVAFTYFVKAPTIKVSNTTAEKVELIYEITKKNLDDSNERESKKSTAQEVSTNSLSDKIYALGEVDYVNIITQSDEIS